MPTLDWLNPFSIVDEDGAWDTSAFAAGLVITLFIYWGWDTTATVNEESAQPDRAAGPGHDRLGRSSSSVTYVIVTIAAQALPRGPVPGRARARATSSRAWPTRSSARRSTSC